MTDADVTEPASQHSDAEAPVPYRSGFVAVVGRPNVGKSTLINALIGTQIAIASSRPETTRKAIRGILTTDNAQIVLVDTPGIHRPRTLLGQRLNDGEIVVLEGAHRHNVGEVGELVDFDELVDQSASVQFVDFGDDGDQRHLPFECAVVAFDGEIRTQPAQNAFVTGADFLVGGQQEGDRVDIG